MHQCATLLAAVSLTVALVLAGASADAATSALTFKNQNVASFSDTLTPGSTGFSDLFTFTTSSGSAGASAKVRFNGNKSSPGFSAFNLLDLSHGNSVVATGSIIGSGSVAQLNFARLSSDTTYGLEVVGTIDKPGAVVRYSGNMILNPVAEPGEYVLILCGLGLIGLVAFRRRKGHGLASI